MGSQQGWRLTSLLLGVFFVAICFAEETPDRDDPRVAWLKQHAIPLRSIDPNDEDFTDLEPVGNLIGDSRIVQLGEQSHGDGATFHAKIRLVKFLHQKLGFDVLASEKGLYDRRKTWELLRGGMEPYKASSHGVLGPLFEYIGRAAKGPRPLEPCGFGCFFYGGQDARDFLVKDVTALWDKLASAAPDADQRAAIVNTLTKLANFQQPTPQERQRGHNALAAWRNALEIARPSDALPEAELAFWRQFVASTSTFAAILGWGPDELNSVERLNLRDPQMARNLVWLARTAYPKRKIIVWAASAHLARNLLPTWVKEKVTAVMGHDVWKALAKETYTVAFTAAEGECTLMVMGSLKAWQLPPPAPGSLEDLFVRAGFTDAFLDFRGLGPDGAWLKQKLIARPFAHHNDEANWTDMFDGIIFIKKMYGTTRRSSD